MASYINKDFFSEVWLSLINYTRKRARAAKTVMYRTLIARHLDAYLTAADYQRPQLLHSQQSALIEGQKMYVSYSNNIQMRFGSHLRRVVNVMLNVRQRKENLQRVLRARGIAEDQIRDQIAESITTPARNFKIIS
ncbi:hypothetical protein G6F56_013894 [Rhizopus delemar]|nr:hypothetical protein G6F56_013894 [Rhizopus delemar]